MYVKFTISSDVYHLALHVQQLRSTPGFTWSMLKRRVTADFKSTPPSAAIWSSSWGKYMFQILPKTNIAPENRPSQKKPIVFQSSMFRCYPGFREVIFWIILIYLGSTPPPRSHQHDQHFLVENPYRWRMAQKKKKNNTSCGKKTVNFSHFYVIRTMIRVSWPYE